MVATADGNRPCYGDGCGVSEGIGAIWEYTVIDGERLKSVAGYNPQVMTIKVAYEHLWQVQYAVSASRRVIRTNV